MIGAGFNKTNCTGSGEPIQLSSSSEWAHLVLLAIFLVGFAGTIWSVSSMWFLNQTMKQFFDKIRPAPVSQADKKSLLVFFLLGCTDILVLLRVPIEILRSFKIYGENENGGFESKLAEFLKIYGYCYVPVIFMAIPLESVVRRRLGCRNLSPIKPRGMGGALIVCAAAVSGLAMVLCGLEGKDDWMKSPKNIVAMSILALSFATNSFNLFSGLGGHQAFDKNPLWLRRRQSRPSVRVLGGGGRGYTKSFYTATASFHFILTTAVWILRFRSESEADCGQTRSLLMTTTILELVIMGFRWPIYVAVNRRVLRAHQEVQTRRKCSNPMSTMCTSPGKPSPNDSLENGKETRKTNRGTRKHSRLSAPNSPIHVDFFVNTETVEYGAYTVNPL